jgi:hypothetical protein
MYYFGWLNPVSMWDKYSALFSIQTRDPVGVRLDLLTLR